MPGTSWGVAAGNGHHFVYELLALRRVVHVLHLLEQAVERRAAVVRGVFAVLADLAVGAVEQEHEILRVGVIGVPAPLEYLRGALQHLVLETVVVGRADFQLHADLRLGVAVDEIDDIDSVLSVLKNHRARVLNYSASPRGKNHRQICHFRLRLCPVKPIVRDLKKRGVRVLEAYGEDL